MKPNRKSSKSLNRAARAGVEFLETRQLLSATLSVGNSLMVFNAVQNSSPSQVETLTLTDTGDAALTLGAGSITIANDPGSATQDAARFSLVNASSIPATIAPGASFGLEIDYKAVSVTDLFDSAILEIASNDPVNPTTSVTLHGIGTAGLGGSDQPSLATILQSYDIPTYVGEGPDDADAYQDSTYPYPPDPTSQEVVMQRFVKAGTGPVTIDVLASFTASGAEPYTLGTYTPGDPTSLNQLFTTPASEDQSTYVQPQGTTSFDPGSSEFGFYCVSNVQVTGRIIYSEDSLNTFDSTTGRHFRFFPMEEPDGTVVPDEYIMTSTEWDAPVGYDFTNIVAVVSNIEAAPGAPTAPVIGLQNLNAEPGSNTMVFSTIQNQNTTIGDTVHNTGKLQINNTGGSALVISSYTLSSQWELVDPPTFPVTVAAGADLDLSIKFIATTEPTVPYNETNATYFPNNGGVYDGTLVLDSNDPNDPTASVPLAGYWQDESQNSNEPSLQTIVNLMFGYQTEINPTPIPDLTESLNTPSPAVYYGQETVSGYWAEADTALSVTVQEIASWHTQGNNSTTYWFTEGSSSKNKLFETASDDGQTLFPYANGTTTPAEASFSSTGDFGFWFDTESSVDALNTTNPDDGGHHVRFYPVIASDGLPVPNTYIAAMDYSNIGGQNFDYNDNVYLITNVHPVQVVSGITAPQTTGAPATPTDLNAVASDSGVSLQWAPIHDPDVTGYNVYSSPAETTGFSLLASDVTSTSYLDTTAPAGTAVYYKVTAVDSNGTESLGDVAATTTLGTAPSGLSSLDIGATPSGSTTVVTAGTAYDVTAGGPGVTGTADGFRFLYQQETGNFDVKVQVQSITVAGNYATAGIMARSTLDTDSPNVYMSASPANYRFKDRTTVAGTENVVVGANTSSPAVWVRLTRVGDVFDGYSSPDGINWTLVSSVTVDLPTRLYLGLAVASNDSTQTTTADLASYGDTSGGPAANPFSANAISGAPTVLDVLGVDSDPTGTLDPATVTITTPPNHGGQAVVNTTTGAITYTSAPGFTGTETFSYTVGDDIVTSSPALVTITVSAAGLVTNPATFDVVAGQTFLANVLASDTDSTGTIEPDTLAVVGDSSAPDVDGTAVVESGEISFTPAAGFTGTDTIDYTVQDSTGVTSLPTAVTFVVTSGGNGGTGGGTAPVANPVSTTVASGQSVRIDVLASDSAVNGLNPATVAVVSGPAHGTTAVNASTGVITYTGAADFTGTDSFTYTVEDDKGQLSNTATVTIVVTATGPIATNISAPSLVGTGPVTVDVLKNAGDTTGTLNPASVTITTGPADGTAAVNTANGSITYTPDPGFVGTDTLQYTVGDGSSVSAPATLSLPVGVSFGSSLDKTADFTDPNGNRVTISLSGLGTVELFFTGSGKSQIVKGGHGGALAVTGTGLGLSGIDITGTTTGSSVSITRKGNSALALGGVTVTGSINHFSAPDSALTGTLAVSGSVGLVQLASASGADITVGTGSSPFELVAGDLYDTALSSQTPVKLIKLTQWTGTAGADTLDAPSIASLSVSGAFDAAVQLDSTGKTAALAAARIGGAVGVGGWNVIGNAGSVTVGSAASNWGGLTVSGTLAGLTVASGGLNSNISAGAIGTLKVAGTIDADITTTGGLKSLQAGALVDSLVDVGSTATTAAAATADNIGSATLGSLRLTGKAADTFSDSNVIAGVIGSAVTGPINTANGGTAEGIAAATIKAASVNDDGTVLSLNAKTLLSDSAIASFLTTKNKSLGSFAIEIV